LDGNSKVHIEPQKIPVVPLTPVDPKANDNAGISGLNDNSKVQTVAKKVPKGNSRRLGALDDMFGMA